MRENRLSRGQNDGSPGQLNDSQKNVLFCPFLVDFVDMLCCSIFNNLYVTCLWRTVVCSLSNA